MRLTENSSITFQEDSDYKFGFKMVFRNTGQIKVFSFALYLIKYVLNFNYSKIRTRKS